MNYFHNVVVSAYERSCIELLEPFDEHEEWHLKCSHYVLLTAFSGSCLQLVSSMWSHVSEIDGDLVNAEASDCGTFVCMTKQSHHLLPSGSIQPISMQNSCKVLGDTTSTNMSSHIEENQLLTLQDAKPSLCSTAVCNYSLHWRAVELAFNSEETDTRCQRFGHTINRLLINGRCCVVAVGGLSLIHI